MAYKKFNLWKTDSGSVLLEDDVADLDSYFLEEELGSRQIVYSFEAKTWGEALQKRNAFFGYGPYVFKIDPKTNEPEERYYKEFE